MSDAEMLLLIVTAIYVGECARWLRHEAVVFRAFVGERFAVAWPGAVVGNPQGGLVLLNPLPPLGTGFVTQAWPVSVSPRALCNSPVEVLHPEPSPETATSLIKSWDEISRIEADGKKLLVDNAFFAHAATTRSAAELAATLERIRAAAPADRESVLREVVWRAFDSSAVEERIRGVQMSTRTLRWLCIALVLFVFVSGPSMIWSDAVWPHWPWLIVSGLTLLVLAVLDYYLTHRQLHPTAVWARRKHAAMMIFSPLTAMRAVDSLTLDWLAEFHPLAVALRLLPRERFERFAAQVLRDLRFPVPSGAIDNPPEVAQTRAFHRELLEAETLRILEREKLFAAELLAPPARESDDVAAWCPRCHQQFASLASQCAACAGRPVEPLA